jgi:hypothetical protein
MLKEGVLEQYTYIEVLDRKQYEPTRNVYRLATTGLFSDNIMYVYEYIVVVCHPVSATLDNIPGCEAVNECACPGDKLTYNCIVQGSPTGATIWSGTAFSGCQQNAILLQHHQFTTGGSTGTCNNGAIVGQSLGVQGNNYTSQLNVTITPETTGKTITCAYDAFTGQDHTMIEFSTIIPGNHAPLQHNTYTTI